VIDALVKKASAAFDRGGYASLGLSGGVSNNRTLRTALEKAARQRGAAFRPALPQHTGDNAGMIAFAAWCDPEGCARDDGLRLRIQPGLALG
jgi:N6-L-threonylcarbamoyladenine synthase